MVQEVACVFGNLPESDTTNDRAISAAIMGYWVDFVRRSNPNEPAIALKSPVWA
jgi:hypothetical protein